MAGSTLAFPSAERRVYSPWRETWRRYRRHRLAVVSAVLLLVLIAAVVFGPFVWRISINDMCATPAVVSLGLDQAVESLTGAFSKDSP